MRVCEARPRARSLPVPQPPPAVHSAAGSAAPMTTSFLGARLLQAVQGDFERRTGGERALDQRVRARGRAASATIASSQADDRVTIARRIERRRCRGEMGRQRRRRRKIIGTDRARGQGRANESAENGGAVSRRVAVGAIARRRQSFVSPSTDRCTPTHRRGAAQSNKRQPAAAPTRHARTTCGWCPPAVQHRSFRRGTQATVSRCPRKSGAERLHGHSA